MENNTVDIHEDSGLYLQEYISSLENLPSEIRYHWAEIKNRNDQAKAPEKRIKSAQHELSKLHRQWFDGDPQKRERLKKHEPVLIQRIETDYAKLQDLANERIHLAQEALTLVEKHLQRLDSDLQKHDAAHPESVPHILETRSYTIPHGVSTATTATNTDSELEDDNTVEIKLEQPDYQTMIANRNQKRKKKEERDKDEPLYCFCQQVSYGEMVACDGENCPFEWFHMDCVGLDEPPKGAWYCEDCLNELRNKRRHQPIHKKMKRKRDSQI
ncbi:hypothetical protein INT47_011543 [Mucor saturninus]|uniref:Chromatin modification-related protein n=1 Tax=Mucor saturninus TaxID=64648 RepID=A0A8H7UUU1_9FUNG|nr:hypothetical protein INT47_011543 [Mucor saturninus]